MDTKKLVRAISDKYQSQKATGFIEMSLEDYIADQLDKVKSIHSNIRSYDIAIDKLKKKYEDYYKRLEKDILVANRNKCEHLIKTRHYDPSGGSDSFTECDICGKEL